MCAHVSVYVCVLSPNIKYILSVAYHLKNWYKHRPRYGDKCGDRQIYIYKKKNPGKVSLKKPNRDTLHHNIHGHLQKYNHNKIVVFGKTKYNQKLKQKEQVT